MIYSQQLVSTAQAVTPNDSTVFQAGILYVGTAGDVRVITYGGNTVTFVAVPAGMTLYVLATSVLATSTTASNILVMR